MKPKEILIYYKNHLRFVHEKIKIFDFDFQHIEYAQLNVLNINHVNNENILLFEKKQQVLHQLNCSSTYLASFSQVIPFSLA